MQKNWKAENHRKGFTTVELVVVTIIILILSGGIILGLVSWYRNAQFRKQNEYAQTIFSAAQNRLTEYSYSGNLEELEELLEENGAKSIDRELEAGKIIGNNGKPYDMEQVWYESKDKADTEKSKYQGTIYSLIGTPKDYQAYKSDNYTNMTEEEEALTQALYEMLETYIYDTSLFSEGVVCVEFSASDGQVFAALYSDRQEDFTYGANASGEKDTIDICDRTQSRRKKVMLGYYGVDTMAKATSSKAEKPVISEVRLNNEETLNLSFKLGKGKSAWNQLTYQVDVYNAASNNIGLSIILNAKDGTDGGKYRWPDSYNSKKQVLGTVKRYWYDKSGKSTAVTLGKYKFYLYVESNGMVHLVLDAADLSATSQNYLAAYGNNGIGTSDYKRPDYAGLESADELLNESYSFHRFGLSAEKIYCKIKASGTGYKPTALKKSNISDVYYGDESTADKEKGKTTYNYEIANARHLYNMRYIEDTGRKNQDQFKGNEKNLADYAYAVPEAMTWELTADVDWQKLIKDQFYFDSGEVEKKDTQFLSIMQLREDSVFETKDYSKQNWTLSKDNHKIKGLEITYQANKKAGADEEWESTGFFLTNEGEIRGITLDGITVTGVNKVGAFCGINTGVLENLLVDDAYAKSRVSGRPDTESGQAEGGDGKAASQRKADKTSEEWGECIGGIFGVHESKNASGDPAFYRLQNRAEVTGVKFVGGITGWLTGMGGQDITVKECRNYGAVYADEESENPMFIGGILGYAQNQKKNKEHFFISDCMSSPQYDAQTVLEIVQGVKDGTRQLKGTYVGGIVGYNQGCEITDCSTENENSSHQGYVFGDKYVGGIVGISSGLTGRIDGNGCVNEANVVGNTYVGGIVGCNAAPVVSGGHYIADNEEGTPFKAVEDTDYAVKPEKNRDLKVEINHWTNRGAAIAFGNYAGGITGYNTGRIFGCSSEVDGDLNQEFLSVVGDIDGDYAGGIAGYNNGIIGNTERNEQGQALGYSKETISTVCYILGHNYVGGVVGYNDVDALIEDYELAGGYIKASGNFAGGYVGLNASLCLLQYTNDTATGDHSSGEARELVSKPNEVTGTYFVGGIIGGNLVCANSRINTVFEVDNFLGSIHAKAYAGGFIGLNSILKSGGDQKARVKAYQEGLLEAAENTETVTYNFAEAVPADGGFASSGNLRMSITGQGAGSIAASRLGSLNVEEVFAGGVIGYSKDMNDLLIQDVENLTPVTAGGTIPETAAKEQEGRSDASSFAYAYAGGIIGKVGSNTTLDNCSNQDVGDVRVSEDATYTGGLCEINQGTILNCKASSVGSNVKDKVGGICGVNLGTISECRIERSTITGRNEVGGITAENFGWIEDISLISANILASGDNAGGIAGYNGKFGDLQGYIFLSARGPFELVDTVKVSGHTNVGGLIGKNESGLWTWPNKSDQSIDQVIIGGSVSGAMNVGGIVGENNQEINHFISQCNVTASVDNAGGIVGFNKGSVIVNECENQGTVTATAGNAGGIVAENSGEIVSCINHGNIFAAAGNAGGISASNAGVIQRCEVSAKVAVSITGMEAAGGISGKNGGRILQCSIENIGVHNTSKSTKESLVGGIAGRNEGEIQLAEGTILNSTVKAYANGSSAGGIAGENAGGGVISGEAPGISWTKIENVDLATDTSISYCNLGGIAGKQSDASSVVKGCRVLDTQIGKLALLGNTDQGYGGIAGTNAGTIQNCSFDGRITAGGNASNIANLGGITGKNTSGGLIEQCYIGIDDGKANTTIQSGEDQKNTIYTAYAGGIAGWNFGTIQNCDNQGNGSNDKVVISGNGGIVGGIAGRNEAGAIVTGLSETQKLSTGKNWSVKHYFYINDSGTGGICGWSGSGQSMKYVENYANVANLSGIINSTAVGGLIGRLENQESYDFTMENCKNEGNINGPSNTGGFVGRWKYNGGTIKNSSNSGEIGNTNNLVTGGIIASLYDLTDGAAITVTGCVNHGDILGKEGGGIVGKPNMCNTSNRVIISDCINTGNISTEIGAGIMENAEKNTSVSFNRCRNYGSNTKGSFYGIVYYNNNLIKMQDCFDFSGKGLVQKLDNPANKIVNSYYYTKEIDAGMTEEEAKLAVEAAEVKVRDAQKAVEEAKEELNQVSDTGYGDHVYYDSSAEEKFYDHSVMKHDTGSGYNGGFEGVFGGALSNKIGYQLVNVNTAKAIKEGNPLDLNFTFAKTVLGLDTNESVNTLNYPEIRSFGIYWGSNSNGNYTRGYIYTVSYTTQDGKVRYLKAENADPANNISVKFDDTTVSAYKNYGGLFSKVKAVDDPNEATRFFTFGLSKGTSQENADSYARFDLSSQEQVKNINFHVESIASNDNKGDIRNMISSQELKYSTAGTVNKFTASTTKGADELTYQENDPENHVLSFAQASPSEEWQEASTTYENAEEGYQQARKDLEKAQKRLDDIKNGESIDEDANAPSDDPGKTGLSMYAAKTEHVVNGEYYNLKSGSSITPNFLKAVMIPSITAREAGRRLRNVAYSGLDQPSADQQYTLVEQYYLDAYDLLMNDQNVEFTVSNSGGKVTLRIKAVSGAYGYQMCEQLEGQSGAGSVSNPVFIPNVVTSADRKGDYVEYELSLEKDWYDSQMNFYIRAINGTAYMSYYDAEENFTDAKGQYQAPTSSDWDQDGQYAAGNVSKWTTQQVRLSAPQAAPKVHLELIYQKDKNTFGWKPVLENKEDFPAGTEIQVYASTDSANQVVSNGNLRFTITVGEDGNYTSKEGNVLSTTHQNNLNFAAKALAVEGVASDSILVMHQSAFYGVDILKNNNLFVAQWNGFYGNEPDRLSYQIGVKPGAGFDASRALDLYIDSEMVVSDYLELEDGTRVDVAVSSGQSHVTSIGSTTFISELSGLPANLLEEYEDYTVRAYPWTNQWYICRYGHIVKDAVKENELSDVTDAQKDGEAIFTEDAQGKKELRPGYVIRLEKDGTYTVIYSIFLEYGDRFKNQVKHNELSVHEETDGQRTYVSQSASQNQIKIQTNPVITEDGCTVQPTGDGAEYTFKWDEGSVERNAVYHAQLYGIAADGGRTLLATQNGIKAKECTFEDAGGSWNYSNMILRVIRIGAPEDQAAAASTRLTFYTERKFDVKLALERIAKPKVNLHEENGVKDKDHLYYDVEWNGISQTGMGQMEEHLAGYAVTAERSQDDTVCSHYDEAGIQAVKEDLEAKGYTALSDAQTDAVAYTKTAVPSDSWIYSKVDRVEKTVVITKNEDGTYTAHKKEIWTFLELSGEEKESSAKIVRTIDLSEFTGEMKLVISVKALASEESSVYKDGPAGVGSEMTLPKRLAVPDLEQLLQGNQDSASGDQLEMEEKYSSNESMTLEEMNLLEDESGLHIEICDHNRPASGKYELSMAFYEEYPLTKAEGTEGTGQAGELNGQAVWKYRLKDGKLLTEGTQKQGSYHLPGTQIEVIDEQGETQTLKLSDLAGMYAVLAFRAVADNEISSVWTYEDRHVADYVQFRIPRAKNAPPKLTESQTEVVYSEGGHWENDSTSGGTIVSQTTISSSVEEYAQDILFQLAHESQKVEQIPEYDVLIDMDWIYAKKGADGYSIYLLSTDEKEMEDLASNGPDTDAADRMELGNAKYVGELPIGGSLDLPYKLEVQTGALAVTTTSYLKCQTDGQGNTQLALVLADAQKLDGAAVLNGSRTLFVRVIGLAGDTARYEDSETVTWYRGGEQDAPEDDSLSYLTGALSVREGYPLEVPLAGDSKSHYIYRQPEGDGYGSVYAKNNGEAVDSVLFVEEYNSETILPEFKKVEDQRIFGGWKTAGETLRLFDEDSDADPNITQPRVYLNTQTDQDHYIITIFGYSEAAQLYLERVIKGDGTVYYHVFYNDTQNELSADYPLAGTEKDRRKYQTVNDRMFDQRADFYPSCSEEDQVYYLGDIKEEEDFILPYTLKTVNSDGSKELETWGRLAWSGMTFALTLPDVIGIEKNPEGYPLNQDTMQITYQAAGEKYQSNWWYQDGEYAVSQSDVEENERNFIVMEEKR